MPDNESSVPLYRDMKPAGPVVDAAAAERLLETLIQTADADGWRETLDTAWPALAPVAGASPYLAGLMRRRPDHLRHLLEAEAADGLERILRETDALDGQPDDDEVTSALFAAAFTGPDFAEGVEAFLAKRPAKFP